MPRHRRTSSASKDDEDPFKNPRPGGSKRTASSQPPPTSRSRSTTRRSSSSSGSSDTDANKTPKKARRTTVSSHRNMALWSHFELDPDVPKAQQNKHTKVRGSKSQENASFGFEIRMYLYRSISSQTVRYRSKLLNIVQYRLPSFISLLIAHIVCYRPLSFNTDPTR